jgi:hypothetical protein
MAEDEKGEANPPFYAAMLPLPTRRMPLRIIFPHCQGFS